MRRLKSARANWPAVRVLGLAAIWIGSGCYTGLGGSEGVVASGGASDGEATDGQDSAGDGDSAELCSQPRAGAAPVRRLTRNEFNNTVRDLLGDDSRPADVFVTDEMQGLFASNANAPVTPLVATQYMAAAEALTERALTRLDELLPCDPSAGEDACARAFIESFGARAYRRPLSTAEIDRLLGLYRRGRDDLDRGFDDALGLSLRAILQSPNFVNHVERGVEPGGVDETVRLTGYEVASRLSYFLWNTMPDETLFAAAASGSLDDPEGIEAQARRMLQDERARGAVMNFYTQWLDLEKVEKLEKSSESFPHWSHALRESMLAETQTFIEDIVWGDEPYLERLLLESSSFVNEALADLYGIEGVSGDELRLVELDPAQRAGILSHASILAVTAHGEDTSPVHRGLFVRQRLLCQTTPPPPPDVVPEVPPVEPGTTTRERYSMHLEDPYCRGCHILLNPIGLGLENYDAVGRWRTTEWELPIDATGELIGTDVDGEFDGLVELVHILAQSDQVKACVADLALTYSLGRGRGQDDACSAQALQEEFAASGHDLRELMVSIVKTDSFRHRQGYASAQEVCQ